MIRRLSPEVRDQIAAGEVVERPAHLVKELIENSLDAGSSQIHVRVSQGGRSLYVVDNGKGISQEQLELALERFATSKINVTEDIWQLRTFGFRGEALASAAAISRLRLTSRPLNQESAFQIHSDFGKLSPKASSSLDYGTEIFISELFENVPARLKFLKSETAEYMAIRNVIKSFALSHPQVEFKYLENEKLQFFFSTSEDWRNRCQQVLDATSALFLTQIENEGWKAQVVFADPQTVSKSPKQLWFFVQDRWVQDRSLQTAVIDAYRSLLMHGEYPIAVVKLNLPPDQVDVNIHPTKSQVKFLNPSQAFRTVHHALKKALDKAPWL
ncbi:MAG: DNA mismatch repair endonuclease MutL, partial [Bdellovibrionales bacterium]